MATEKLPVNRLPEELILEVFLRLPRKSLLRSRCVSKGLRDLIDCQTFKKHYDVFHNSVSDFSVMFIEDHRLFSMDFHLPDNPTSSEVKEVSIPHYDYNLFIGCCKGIVCLIDSQALNSCILLNPFNGTFQNVNCSNLYPLLQTHVSIGFGYDCATDDYKIVRSTIITDGNVQYLDVYSMRRDSWGQVVVEFTPGWFSHVFGICLEGAMHWLWWAKSENLLSCVAAFDLESESLRSVPLPPQVQRNPWFKLDDLGGRLSVLVRLPSSRINVWVMTEYGVATSWTPLFNIVNSIERIFGYFPMWDSARLLCLGSNSSLWSWLNTQDGSNENIQIHKLPHQKQGYHVHGYEAISWVCVRSPLRLPCFELQND